MAVTLFDLMAKLTLDTSGFSTNATQAVNQAGGLTSSLEGMTARAVAMGTAMYNMSVNAVNAVWNFGVDLVQTAAEVQAEQAQFASVFAGVEDQAWGVFNRIGSLANIHTGRLMTLGTGIYTQFASAGMESADAMAAMEQTMMLAADAAAFYDISLEDAVHMVRSFLRGNVEAGESIGLFANDVLRTQYAAEMYGAKWAELNELQRESVLLAIAQDTYENANATGQAAREADNYTNVLNNLKETWRQIKGILGEPILNAVLPVMQELEKFLKDNPELVENFADAIGVIASNLSNVFIWLLQFIGDHTDEILSFINGAAALFGFDLPGGTVVDSGSAEDPPIITVYDSGSPEGQAIIAEMAANKQRTIEDAFAALIYAASTSDAADDAAALATWDRLGYQGYMGDSLTREFALELYDAITQYGLGIFGEGVTPDDIIRMITEAEDPAGMETNLDNLLNTVFDQDGNLIAALNSLPDAVANVLTAVLPGALSGVQVVLNDNIVGVVAAGMQRNANAKRFTL